MPGPSNTLLIEGSFAELSEELAHYIDTVGKVEEGQGLVAELQPAISQIREKESPEAEQAVDAASLQPQKDDILKKLVGRAEVLNSAPEKGRGLSRMRTYVY